MLASFAKHFDEQIRATVDYLWMVLEIGNGVDHAKHFEDRLHAVERAKRLARRGEQPKPDEPCALVALLHRDLRANLAGKRVALFVARPLAGKKQQISREPIWHIVRHWRRHFLQHDTELF